MPRLRSVRSGSPIMLGGVLAGGGRPQGRYGLEVERDRLGSSLADIHPFASA